MHAVREEVVVIKTEAVTVPDCLQDAYRDGETEMLVWKNCELGCEGWREERAKNDPKSRVKEAEMLFQGCILCVSNELAFGLKFKSIKEESGHLIIL